MDHGSGPVTYHGTGGSCVQVTANFLRLSVKESTEVSEYEVQFTPQVRKHVCHLKGTGIGEILNFFLIVPGRQQR
jgi:hypothetical protein